MIECPHCSADLDEGDYYCIDCEQQEKCRECDALLKADANICSKCGTSKERDTRGEDKDLVFEYDEQRDGDKYHLNVRLEGDNESAARAAEALGSGMLNRPIGNRGVERNDTGDDVAGQLREENVRNQDSVSEEEDSSEIDDSENAHTSFSEQQEETEGSAGDFDRETKTGETDIFKLIGGELALKEADLKGETKREQQERFVLLYIDAYEDLKEGNATEEEIQAAMKEESLMDANFRRTYFDELKAEYLVGRKDKWSLNQEGEERVSSAKEDIKKSNEKGYEYWKSKERKSRSSVSKEVEEEIDSWVEGSTKGDSFKVESLEYAHDYAIFGIYDIIEGLGERETLSPAEVFLYMKNKYEKISVSKSAIGSSMRRKKGDLFKSTDSGSYYLTEAGKRTAAEWMSEGEKTEYKD